MDFPLIYCNGDSYSNENYHPDLKGKVFANVVSDHYRGFVLNKSINGSNNRRIIRSSVHDLILQRQLNPKQRIVALILLTFELRGEMWSDQATNVSESEESNFVTHTFTGQTNWRENLLAGIDIGSFNNSNSEKTFFKKYSEGRAFFFSPYAERINLFCDLVMLRSLLESLEIEFLVFQGPRVEKLESEYLLDFFKQQLFDDPRFIDLDNFGFTDWCSTQNFIPLDSLDRPEIGHYNVDAHRAFALQILLPKLKELYDIK